MTFYFISKSTINSLYNDSKKNENDKMIKINQIRFRKERTFELVGNEYRRIKNGKN